MHPSSRGHTFFVIAISSMLGACTTSRPAFDENAESATLMRRDADWANLATAGQDADTVVSYWADDAVVMEPGQPAVEGKQAIREMVASSFKTPGFKIHWVSQKPTFSADGRMAYMRGADEMTVPDAKGQPMTLHLQGYSIWRRDADGQWRCVVDISTEKPAAAVVAVSHGT
ncbi:MAG: YybH family protein [Gemmatimonadaceae bacterium]